MNLVILLSASLIPWLDNYPATQSMNSQSCSLVPHADNLKHLKLLDLESTSNKRGHTLHILSVMQATHDINTPKHHISFFFFFIRGSRIHGKLTAVNFGICPSLQETGLGRQLKSREVE